MKRNHISRAKAIDDGRWVQGELHTMTHRPHIHMSSSPSAMKQTLVCANPRYKVNI